MAAQENQVDTIITNANVITIDPARPRAEAIAISDGKFVAVGSTEDVSRLSSPNTKVLDLSGKTVLPFIVRGTPEGPTYRAIRLIWEIQD